MRPSRWPIERKISDKLQLALSLRMPLCIVRWDRYNEWRVHNSLNPVPTDGVQRITRGLTEGAYRAFDHDGEVLVGGVDPNHTGYRVPYSLLEPLEG